MGRAPSALPAGSRVTDYIGLGVVANTFPVNTIHTVLKVTGRASVRKRDLPAPVVVYFVIAMALYMQSSTREVLRLRIPMKSPRRSEMMPPGVTR
jgi:Insertion element 4 transposase N-terminal